MSAVRGKALALALVVVSTSMGYVSFTSPLGEAADSPHSPISITGDTALASNSCSCLANPGAAGTIGDPFIIENWLINYPTGIAIELRDISSTYFVVRDNTLNARTGVKLVNTGDRGQVIDNSITFGNRGVDLWASSTRVTGNTILGPSASAWVFGGEGVLIEGGSPHIEGNYISRAFRGIMAKTASPTILDNDFIENWDALFMTASSTAHIEGNMVRLAQRWGLVVERSASVTMLSNEVREGKGGIVITSASLYMENNTVINQREEAVRFEQSVVTLFRNTIKDNWRGAYGSTDSDVLIVENEFSNNQDAGIRLTRSEGRVLDNRLDRNGIGIRLENSIVTMKDNRLYNNTFGLSIPYQARQSIPLMSGNIVNGLNVDGTLDPTERALYYQAAAVTIENRLFDSGHNQGFFGTTIEQGALVIYDSIDVTVQNNTFAFNHRGILVVNSQFVTIQNNTFSNNHEGVVSINSRAFIKDNDCDIDIDPPQTFCFQAQGGFVAVRGNVVAHVDIGIWFRLNADGGPTQGIIESNVVTQTRIGIQLEGGFDQRPTDIKVRFNRIELNFVGMAMFSFRGTVQENLVANNTGAGIELHARTNATLIANQIIFNEHGVLDVETCTDQWRSKCSGGIFIRNRVRGNAEVGIETHNGGLFQGDIVTRNKVGIRIEGRASLHDVNASFNKRFGVEAKASLVARGGNFTFNGQDGIRVDGDLDARDVNVSLNKHDGIDMRGDATFVGVIALNNSRVGADIRGNADIRHGNFSGNLRAGLRLNGTFFDIRGVCEISHNLNGIIMAEAFVEVTVTPPGLPGLPEVNVPDITAPNIGDLFEDDDGPDPLRVRNCNIFKNEVHAIVATGTTVSIDAMNNFWGFDGPVMDVPGMHRERNTIAAPHAIVTPYWTDRSHREPGLMPTIEGSPLRGS